MINLRYHIVSLTAVFLAIGIGVTLGSTFLDRATVDNLNGQLESLETRLEDRDTRIGDLQDRVDSVDALRTARDEQAVDLLADRLTGVPVVAVAAEGANEAHVRSAVQALVIAGADVQGLWWFTERFVLDDDAEVSDLSAILDASSTDPSRLRRAAIDELGGELRTRQLLLPGPEVTEAPIEPTPDVPADETPTIEAAPGATGEDIDILTQLTAGGFITFEAVPGGPDAATFPDGTRLLLIGGSRSIPDDLVMEPLVERMSRATAVPVLAVAGSALGDENGISDLVAVIRQDDRLRGLVPTVDTLDHFEGWAAMVLAMQDVGDGVVGHYGLGDGATRLLPELQDP